MEAMRLTIFSATSRLEAGPKASALSYKEHAVVGAADGCACKVAHDQVRVF